MLNYILCVNRSSLSLLSQHNFLSRWMYQLGHVVVRKVLQLWMNQAAAMCEDKSNNVHESVHLLSPLHPFITHRYSVTKLLWLQLWLAKNSFFTIVLLLPTTKRDAKPWLSGGRGGEMWPKFTKSPQMLTRCLPPYNSSEIFCGLQIWLPQITPTLKLWGDQLCTGRLPSHFWCDWSKKDFVLSSAISNAPGVLLSVIIRKNLLSICPHEFMNRFLSWLELLAISLIVSKGEWFPEYALPH